MIKDLKKKHALDTEQLEHISFIEKHPKETANWNAIAEKINNNQLGDPQGPDGEVAMKAFTDLNKAQVEYKKSMQPKDMMQEDIAKVQKYLHKAFSEVTQLNADGNMWFTKAFIANRFKRWMTVLKDALENKDVDPASKAGEQFAKQWREAVAENCTGEGTFDFHLGRILFSHSYQAKMESFKSERYTDQQKQQMADESKLINDPFVWQWIIKVLEKH